MSTFRLGSDVGGTFTDFVLLDRDTGSYSVSKVLTTPTDPSEGVDAGVASLAEENADMLSATEVVIHGTTLVINAIIERKGAATALITTKGFRDILEMRREIRYDMYDLAAEYPIPLIQRDLRREVDERTGSSGVVLKAPVRTEVEAVLADLASEGIESVAVCFLHSYACPDNERFVREVALETPELTISLSSDVFPERKEFERTCATVLNAYVKPLVQRYLARLEQRLEARGLGNRLALMLSGGGITSPLVASDYPVRLVESGPVGGAVAAMHLGQQAGVKDVVAFDMGGTTAKACLIRDGRMQVTKDLEVDRVHRFKKGSGTPTAVPSVDLIEVGAGGGSIARIGRTGILEVGPDSSGADPGPICYRRGGKDATVTDADVVLGYLDPTFFLGGKMNLDAAGAAAGIAQQVGHPLGLTDVEAAAGIHEVVNENMASAIRTYVAERGGDLTKASLVAFGGAGPVHAHRLARSLGMPRILVPRAASVFSALGFLVAPISFESSRTYHAKLAGLDTSQLEAQYRELERQAERLIRTAAPEDPISFTRAAEMSYVGQSHHIRVDLPSSDEPLDAGDVLARFSAEYRSLYGMSYEDLEVQLVTLVATATAVRPAPPISSPFRSTGADVSAARKGGRPAYDPPTAQYIEHDVYAMDLLEGDMTLEGPAIIEDPGTTFVLGDGGAARVDARGWLEVTV